MKREIIIALAVAVIAALPAAAHAWEIDGSDTGFQSYVDSNRDGVLEEDNNGNGIPNEPGDNYWKPSDGGSGVVQCVDGAGKKCDVCPADADTSKKDANGNVVVDSCTAEVICIDKDGTACDACPDDADLDQADADGNLVVDSCTAEVVCIDQDGKTCDACPTDADLDQRDADGKVIVESCLSLDKGTTPVAGASFLDADAGCSLIPVGGAPSFFPLMGLLMTGMALLGARRRRAR